MAEITTVLKKKIIEYLRDNNSVQYNLLKAIEELNELSVELTQYMSKTETVMDPERVKALHHEYADVKLRLEVLDGFLFDEKKVKQHEQQKLNKWKTKVVQKKKNI